MKPMNRAYSILEIKAVDAEKRIIEGIASTPTPDRMGDVVDPKGAKFALPMPLLWQHRSSEPIGHVFFAKPTKDGIPFKAQLAFTDEPGTLKDRLDEAWQSIKLGLVRAVSIGFQAIKYNIMKDGGLEFVEWEWLELSAVTIPANAEATITTIRSIDSEQRAASGRAELVIDHRAGATAKPQPVVKTLEPTQMKKTLAEQISAFEATRQAKAARMLELMDAVAEKGETLSEEAQQEYDTLKGEVESIDKHLVRLGDMQRLNVTRAAAADGESAGAASASRSGNGAATRIVVAEPKKMDRTLLFARFVRAMAQGKGNHATAEMVVRGNERWMAESPELIDVIRTAVNAGTSADSTWAGPLVNYQILASEFIEYLRPKTIIGRIPGLRNVPFNVKVPRQTGTGTVNWVGEGKVKPLTSLAFDTVTLQFAKIAGIIPLTDELVRFSNPAADLLVRDELAKCIIQFMDSAFLDPSKSSTDVSPASITQGVTPITATGATPTALRDDLITLVQQFLSNNLGLGGAVFVTSEQLAFAIGAMISTLGIPSFPGMNIAANGEGNLMGIPLIASENAPTTGGSPTDGGMIILIKAPEVMLADGGQVTIDASREASLQMDTAPDSPNTASTVMVSMFQQNMVAIRAERYINWVKRRSTAVSMIQSAKYTA